MRYRTVRWIVAGLLAVLAAAFPAAGIALAGQTGQQGKTAGTQALEYRDRELLTVIRFANLWEIPMGKLATERGTTKEVKTAGSVMLADHTKLNTVVEQLADKFGVQIPDEAKSTHQGWMAEIGSKTGEDFDRTFATRLRAAHGSVFSTIAEVRAGTNNKTILDFATQANDIVLKHMTLLEATGYVDGQAGHFAEAATRTQTYPENDLSASDIVLGGVAFLVVSVGTVLAVRMLSARGSSN